MRSARYDKEKPVVEQDVVTSADGSFAAHGGLIGHEAAAKETEPNKPQFIRDLLFTFEVLQQEHRKQVLRTLLAYFDISKEDL